MPAGDIATTKQFVSGQPMVDGPDLNAITGQASIQPAFYSAQNTGSSPGDSDYLLLLSSGNAYYKILYQNFFNTNRVRLAAGIPQNVTTINGDMSVWQRGTSFPSLITGNYAADRIAVGFVLSAGSVNISQVALSGSLVSGNYQPAFALRATVATVNSSPAAGDAYFLQQRIELRQARKLFGGVSSLQLGVRTSVAGTYCLAIRNANTTQTFKQDFNVGTPNTWVQLSLPNIPAMPTGSGNWGTNETDLSYLISISLLAGSTFQSSSQSTWVSGNFIGSSAQTNLLATLNATFDICLLQHESGPVCTTFLPDPDFGTTLVKCQRYYCQSYDIGVAAGTATVNGYQTFICEDTLHGRGNVKFPAYMRINPTITLYNFNTGATTTVWDSTNSTSIGSSPVPLGATGAGFSGVSFTSGGTAGHALAEQYTANAEL